MSFQLRFCLARNLNLFFSDSFITDNFALNGQQSYQQGAAAAASSNVNTNSNTKSNKRHFSGSASSLQNSGKI